MRKNRVIEQNRCYHLVSRLAHHAFFLDDEEKDCAVALMRRVEAGVKASMSYCINRSVSISSDPFDPRRHNKNEFSLLLDPRSDPYDAVTIILGTIWHDILGRRGDLHVKGDWIKRTLIGGNW